MEGFMTTLEQAKQMADGYKVVPISREILSDTVTPMEVLRILKGVSKHCYMLESVENQEVWGRYTFLGYDPKLEITCMNGEMCIRESGSEEGAKEPVAHPGAKIKEILKEYTSPKVKDLPSFTGGLVGYFSYDYVKYSEPKLNLDADDQEGFKDVDLMLFDKVIAFDNLRQKIYIIANAIISTLYRAEIADNHQFFSVIINPSECNNALLVVIMRNPAKALPGIIILPKLRMFQIKSI